MGAKNLRDRYQGRCIESSRRILKSGFSSESKFPDTLLKPDLYCFLKISRSDAACTDRSLFYASAFSDPDGLQVGKVPALGFVVSVADVVPHHGAFSTYIACTGHFCLLVEFGLPRLTAFVLREKTWIANIPGDKMQGH